MSMKSVGDAQNTTVRVVLWRGTDNPASASQLRVAERAAITYFDGWCAYCASRQPAHFDHAVPSNREYLGENCVGNRVPACQPCNSEKGGNQDFREFLGQRPEGGQRIAKIVSYMDAHGYCPPPLGGDPEARAIMERVRANVAASIQKGIEAWRELRRHRAA